MRLPNAKVSYPNVSLILSLLPRAPIDRSGEVTAHGLLIEVPSQKDANFYAKLCTLVSPYKHGGYAFEGDWIRPGSKLVCEIGSLILTGWKRGAVTTDRGQKLWGVTRAGLVVLPDSSPQMGYDYLSGKYSDDDAIENRIKECLKAISELKGPNSSVSEVRTAIRFRIKAWEAEKERMEASLLKKISTSSVDALALQIVRVGYRTLAMEMHPDLGGSTVQMAALNEARRQLTEVVKKAIG